MKDKIKRPSATTAFFNQYDNNDENKESDVVIENEDKDNVYDENDINEKTPSSKLSEGPKEDEEAIEQDDDYLRNLAQGKKPKKNRPKKVFTSFYMDPDLAAVIDKMMKNAEKGDKSKLLNTAIRKLLEEYGAISK